jgi:hypothetical protein
LYDEIPSLILETKEELFEKLNFNAKPQFKEDFEKSFVSRIFKTADGCATKRIIDIIKRLGNSTID